MKKSIKTIVVALILIFVMMQISSMAYAINIPDATSDFYVNDFAGVFSAEQKSRLINNAVTFSDEHDGVQVVVSTVESLDGNTVEDYANEMYNKYGIGKDDMGVLILLSTGDRKIRMEVGKSMEAYITDSKAGKLIDKYAISYLKEDNFTDGLISLQEAVFHEIDTSLSKEETVPVRSSTSNSNLVPTILACIVIIAILGLFLALIYQNIMKSKIIDSLKTELSNQEQESQEKISRIEERYNEIIRYKSSSIDEYANEFASLEKKYRDLSRSHQVLSDRYERVQRLYPTADQEVTAMIQEEKKQEDIAAAHNVDSTIQKVVNLQPSKDLVDKFASALRSYSRLTPTQKSYIKSDVDQLEKLWFDSVRLKDEYEQKVAEENAKKSATAAANSILSIISSISIGRSIYLSKLKEAKEIYDRLDPKCLPYFDKSVYRRLETLYSQAKRDADEIEEENRRRRRMQEEEDRRRRMSSSHSSFESSSHHSGFGGHSGGGGASRGF